jgi:hypothetical protein
MKHNKIKRDVIKVLSFSFDMWQEICIDSICHVIWHYSS